MSLDRSKLNYSRDVYDIIEYECHQKYWQVVVHSLSKELLHAYKNCAVHYPSKEDPRLKIMVCVTPDKCNYSADHKEDLRRIVLVVYLLSILEDR